MNTVAIIQARMGSSRLPGKVPTRLGDKPVLQWVVGRATAAPHIDRVVVATSDLVHDQPIADFCQQAGVPCVQGSESDVLDRFRFAAGRHNAEAVVRITGDCPLLDPHITGQVVQLLQAGGCAYASNVEPRYFPRGLDTEAFTVAALYEAAAQAKETYEREHVTPYMTEHPDRFPRASITPDADYSQHRWTLDTPEDLELLRALVARLPKMFDWRDVLAVVEADPSLQAINSGVQQKPTK